MHSEGTRGQSSLAKTMFVVNDTGDLAFGVGWLPFFESRPASHLLNKTCGWCCCLRFVYAVNLYAAFVFFFFCGAVCACGCNVPMPLATKMSEFASHCGESLLEIQELLRDCHCDAMDCQHRPYQALHTELFSIHAEILTEFQNSSEWDQSPKWPIVARQATV